MPITMLRGVDPLQSRVGRLIVGERIAALAGMQFGLTGSARDTLAKAADHLVSLP